MNELSFFSRLTSGEEREFLKERFFCLNSIEIEIERKNKCYVREGEE